MSRQVGVAARETLKFRETPKALPTKPVAATRRWLLGKLGGMVTTAEMIQWAILSQASLVRGRCIDCKGVGVRDVHTLNRQSRPTRKGVHWRRPRVLQR